MKTTMTRCVQCGTRFENVTGRRKLCDKCREVNLKIKAQQACEAAKKPKIKTKRKPKYSIKDIFALQEKIKEETGEYPTYGQAVEILEKGELK